jgi:2-keto-3-deoxy-6-phosphogluconate aldolase
MIVQHAVEELGLHIVSGQDLAREITGGYASDLLSCAMAGGREGNVWVTLQAHPNVVAVASLVGMSAVIITEGVVPDPETVRKAQENGVTLLATPKTTFAVVGELFALGVRGHARPDR